MNVQNEYNYTPRIEDKYDLKDIMIESGLFEDNFITDTGNSNPNELSRDISTPQGLKYEYEQTLKSTKNQNTSCVSYCSGVSLQKRKYTPLYAPVSYDKSDSLIYFPSTFSRLINSADFDDLSKLFKSKMTMNCDMNVSFVDVQPNTQNLSDIYAFTVEMFPDTVMCVDSVTVEENQIRAIMYRKFTDVKAIKEGLVRTVKTPIQSAMLPTFLRMERYLSFGLSKKETKKMKEILQQESDLEVFLRIKMNLTLDKQCKKVVKLEVIPELSSITPLGSMYSNQSTS